MYASTVDPLPQSHVNRIRVRLCPVVVVLTEHGVVFAPAPVVPEHLFHVALGVEQATSQNSEHEDAWRMNRR